MSEAIIVAIITGLLTLTGTALTVRAGTKKSEEQFKIQQAVIQTELKQLTDEVREHNNFAKRMPVVEEQVKTINTRLDKLEKK